MNIIGSKFKITFLNKVDFKGHKVVQKARQNCTFI